MSVRLRRLCLSLKVVLVPAELAGVSAHAVLTWRDARVILPRSCLLAAQLPVRSWAGYGSMTGMAEIHGTEVQQLGRLEPVDPRSIWSHEALNFTPWLAQNGDRLAEALGIELQVEGTEYAVGGYSLDIFGKDQTNDVVLIVENQLGESDHSHLGQLLTYAAGTAASTIAWITTRFRDEHRQALT